MSRGIRLLTDSKTSDRENGTVPKRPRPIMAETDCDVVHCPTMGGGGGGGVGGRGVRDTRDSLDCICREGKNGRDMTFLTNL